MRKKIITATFIGATATGKTAFFNRFASLSFNFPSYGEGREGKDGVEYATKNFRTKKEYKWQLWNTTSKKQFRKIPNSYLEDADVVLIFVDSTHPAQSIKELVGFKNIPENAACAVIFTKSDHEKAFKFTEDNCLSYVIKIQIALNIAATQFRAASSYFITSAKNNMGIDKAMAAMEIAALSPVPKTKPPKKKMISVLSFGDGSSRTLFYPREHREKKPPEVNITFEKLGF